MVSQIKMPFEQSFLESRGGGGGGGGVRLALPG